MKHLLLVTAISISSLTYADSGFYTSLKSGISDTKFDNSKDQISVAEIEDVKFNLYNKDTDETIYPNVAVALGFDFSKISKVNARAELEYTYKDKAKFNPNVGKVLVEFDGGSETIDAPEGFNNYLFTNKLRSQSLMLNGYYDFKNVSKFTPYLSTGVGVTSIKNTQMLNPEMSQVEEELNLSDTSNSFTWSVGAGVAYKVTENVALDLGYRYVDAGEIEFNNNIQDFANLKTTADLISHDYTLGLRYNF